ncbi:hypothetical protein ACOMHN_014589 [Nucella lapillus]
MNMDTVVFAVIVVGCLATLTSGQGSARCVETLLADVETCFSKQGIGLVLKSGQQDATMLMRETQAMDPAVQCKNLPGYMGALNCSLGILRQCLDTVNMGGSIPNSGSFLQGMKAVCARQDEFDSECLKSHYPDILRCGEETVKREVQRRSKSLTMEQIICLSADVNYDCSNMHLMNCGNNTHEIYMEQLSKYQVPAACVNTPPGRAGKPIYVHNYAAGAGTLLLGGLAAASSLLLHLIILH